MILESRKGRVKYCMRIWVNEIDLERDITANENNGDVDECPLIASLAYVRFVRTKLSIFMAV